MNEETIYKVFKKLVGNIKPIGDTSIDNERFDNLKVFCEVIEKAMVELDDIVYIYKGSQEYSIKRSVEYVENFLKNLN